MSRRPNLTKEQKEFAAEKREIGWSHLRIARRLGVSEGSIAWHCLQMGADPPNARPLDKTIKGPMVAMRNGKPVRRFTPEEDEQLQRMAIEGKTDCEIGRALGRQPNSIHGRLMILARHEARAEKASHSDRVPSPGSVAA